MKKIVLACMIITSHSAFAFDSTITTSVAGCTDVEKTEKLLNYARAKDTEAFTNALLIGMNKGECTMFQQGEAVFVTEVKITGLNKVRRAGATPEYWIIREALKR